MVTMLPLMATSDSRLSTHDEGIPGFAAIDKLTKTLVAEVKLNTCFWLVVSGWPFLSAIIHLPIIFSATLRSGSTGTTELSSFEEHDVNTLAPQIRMAAKAAIERAHNELARFVEREQARQDVNIQL
jgi:hypothetical protein